MGVMMQIICKYVTHILDKMVDFFNEVWTLIGEKTSNPTVFTMLRKGHSRPKHVAFAALSWLKSDWLTRLVRPNGFDRSLRRRLSIKGAQMRAYIPGRMRYPISRPKLRTCFSLALTRLGELELPSLRHPNRPGRGSWTSKRVQATP